MPSVGMTGSNTLANSMITPEVSIVIASHEGMEYLPACLDSVFAQTNSGFEVIFVDSASTDGSLDYVMAVYPTVKVIRSEVNLGFGKGNNLGAAEARGKYILFLNPDTIVTKDFLTALVQELEANPGVGAAQSKIMRASNRGIIDSAGAYLTWTGVWVHSMRGEPDDLIGSDPVEVLGACGTCLLVRRDLFEELAGFDPDFFVYFDDADFSWRVWQLGFSVVMVPGSVIYHWGSGTTKLLPSVFTVFHSFKNRVCSLLKLLSAADLIAIMPIHLTLCLAGAIAYFIKLKPSNGLAILQALAWNILNLRRTLQKRSTIAKSLADDQRSKYRELMRPLPLGYFVRTSLGYVSEW